MTHSRLDRRSFLKLSSLVGAAAFAPTILVRRAFGALAGADAPDRILVLIEMAGGNDGLNTVVPFASDAYRKARGALALGAQDVLAIDDARGLHKDLEPLKAAFDSGKLAIVEGVGYPDPVRSHFLSSDIWQAGDLEGRRLGTGWVGRLVDQRFRDVDDPNLVMAITPRVPLSCEADEHRAVTFDSPGNYRLKGDAGAAKTLDSAVSSQDVSERARAFLRKAYLDARASSRSVAEAVKGYQAAAQYPGDKLANDLKNVAALIAGGLGTRVYVLQAAGFDTHSGQLGRQSRLFRELASSLAAFQSDLESHGLAERVVVMTFSEFGRRVAANASGGTDHGTAGPMFVLGKRVKGGLYGKPASLESLDQNGDLVFTTDFRRAYAAVIDRWFGGDSHAVLGERFEPLAFLA